MANPDRPVRLIIDGQGHPLLDSHQQPTKAMRVTYDCGDGTRGTVLVRTDSPDVLVAEVEQPREWTDGDVVAGNYTVWTRTAGKWHTVTEHGVSTAHDSDMEQALQLDPATRTLRYQAGGDA